MTGTVPAPRIPFPCCIIFLTAETSKMLLIRLPKGYLLYTLHFSTEAQLTQLNSPFLTSVGKKNKKKLVITWGLCRTGPDKMAVKLVRTCVQFSRCRGSSTSSPLMISFVSSFTSLSLLLKENDFGEKLSNIIVKCIQKYSGKSHNVQSFNYSVHCFHNPH